MDDLEKRVFAILDSDDFNDLPFEEREKIIKYTSIQQILTLWQVIAKDIDLTTAAWRRKQRDWLKNIVKYYENKYMKEEDKQ